MLFKKHCCELFFCKTVVFLKLTGGSSDANPKNTGFILVRLIKIFEIFLWIVFYSFLRNLAAGLCWDLFCICIIFYCDNFK